MSESEPADRREAIWLAYLADAVTMTELRMLIANGSFDREESYGDPPSGLED